MPPDLDSLRAWAEGLRATHPAWTTPQVLALVALALVLLLLLRAAARGRQRLDADLAAAARARDLTQAQLDAQLTDALRLDRERLAALTRAEAAEASLSDHRAALAGTEADLRARGTALAEARAALERLTQTLADERDARRGDAALLARLQADLAAARREAAEKIELLSTIRKEMEDRFKALADETMRRHGEDFAKSNRERLEAVLTPLKDHVGRFEQELRAVHEGALKDREALRAEIAQLTRRSEEVSREAVALTRALKGEKQKQGAWGEMILASILDRSGLQAGVDYLAQDSRRTEDGARYRPDVVVRLPGEKRLVIDSKVSLIDYETAVNADDDGIAQAARRRHLAALRAHITTLSDKGYQTLDEGSVDYVVMFVPIEGALSEALREDGSLTQFALDRHVTIATPTTLMMALRTVAHVWAVEKRNRNAMAIADRAGRLYDKVAGFVEAMQSVGKGLDGAQRSYVTAMDRLTRGSGNVLAQIDTLRSLGARASKNLAVDFDREADAPLPAPDRPAPDQPAPDQPAPADPAKDRPDA